MKKALVPKLLPVDQPAPFKPVIAAGMKALHRGDATPHQQREVFDWLLKQAAGIGSQSFRAGDSHATAFAEGRRFVAVQMMALLEFTTDPQQEG